MRWRKREERWSVESIMVNGKRKLKEIENEMEKERREMEC